MKKESVKVYPKFPGYSVEDCRCKYCKYYIRTEEGKVICGEDPCPYAREKEEAEKAGRIKTQWKSR